jgi:cytoskeletal protein CcmA (bactofilin family)
MALAWTLLLFLLSFFAFMVPLWPAFMELKNKDLAALPIDPHNDGSADYAVRHALSMLGKVQVQGDVDVSPDARVSAVDCTGRLRIGAHASVHSARADHIFLHSGARSLDVASAQAVLWVEPEVQFRWLEAATIRFVANCDDALSVAPLLMPEVPASDRAQQTKFIRVEGNWQPSLDSPIEGDYVVTGDVVLLPAVQVLGSVKAYGNVDLGGNSCVHGSVFAEGGVTLQPKARVLGVVSAGREVQLHAGSVVGRGNQLSSVSAPCVTAHVGACVHGSIQAHKSGASIQAG